jgi:hypothetical protein
MQKPPELLFITVFDKGSQELGLNHLMSLKKQSITNYKAYVTDRDTYERIKTAGFNVEYENIDGYIPTTPKDFGTQEFNRFSYIRYKIINRLLKQKKAVWYMDADTVVLKNLNMFYLNFIQNNDKYKIDMVVQNDLHMLCTGCMFFLPNTKTVEFTQRVFDHSSYEMNDQNYIGYIFRDEKPNISFTVFDYMEFPNGFLYFENQIDVPEEMHEFKRKYENNRAKTTVFVHANWMVGVANKINAFKMRGLWFV